MTIYPLCCSSSAQTYMKHKTTHASHGSQIYPAAVILRVSRVSLDSVERINWNEQKDAPKEKINTEIVFTDLKSPP